LQLVDKSLCLSAAKKKEYEAFSLFRQLLFCISPLRRSPMNLSQLVDSVRLFQRETNYSKRLSSLARGFVTFREKLFPAA
jgi:hypothetical protein